MALSLSLWLASAASGQGVSTAPPETLGFAPERLARIDAYLEAQVEAGHLPGAVVLVARRGQVAYFDRFGYMDRASGEPMRPDVIFRIASMTKPIVSVAVMMLYEEGHFLLNDPVSRYIPAFADPQVLVDLNPADTSYVTEPARREVTIRDLLTHTSGIGYGLFDERLDLIYRQADVADGFDDRPVTLGEKMRVLADLPLAHHPGERFTYGLNTDMLGYLVEVVSGMPLDRFLQERIFTPLGMTDTYFRLPQEKVPRLATLYARTEGGLQLFDESPLRAIWPHASSHYPYEGAGTYLSGGGGLVSTAADYFRFAQMLLNGGVLDGVRLLSPKTVALMTMNHIGSLELDDPPKGKFGLGFWVITDAGHTGELVSEGSYGWEGIWNTRFWVDPQEELIAIFMTQAALYDPGYARFQTLVYQALVEAAAPVPARRGHHVDSSTR